MTGRGGAVARVGAGTRLKGCCDALAVAAVVLTAVAAHWPWFKATLLPLDGAGGPVVAPQGLATGLYAHRSLWVAVAAAVVVLALLAARYLPGGHLRVPDDGVFLVVAALVACLAVAADALFMPGPWADLLSVNGTWALPFLWEGTPYPLDGFNLVMTWDYGALVAAVAAVAALALTIASLAVSNGSGRLR